MLKANKRAITILGIDPGYDRLGWAVGTIKKSKWIDITLDCIQTNRKESLHERYSQIITELEEVIKIFKPECCAIETLYFSKNTKTALKVSESRGIVISILLKHNIPIFEYNPNQIKLTVTGYGKADKRAIEKMIKIQFGDFKKKIIDDAIDALAVVMTHALNN
jgi:crossover junction endodeoxyribonuclease RuvC